MIVIIDNSLVGIKHPGTEWGLFDSVLPILTLMELIYTLPSLPSHISSLLLAYGQQAECPSCSLITYPIGERIAMNVKESLEGGITVVRVEGDFLSEPDQRIFTERIRELVRKGMRHVVIDLAKVKHMNSCGLGSLVCALTTLRKAGGDIRLAGMGTGVHDLFIITQLERIFEVFPTTEQAVDKFQADRK